MRSQKPPHGLHGIRPAAKRRNAGETRGKRPSQQPLHQRAASLSKAHEDLEPACPPAAAQAAPPESQRSALSPRSPIC